MGELLRRCDEAIQKADASDAGSIAQNSDDESLYEFQAAIAVAIEALTTALRCWPSLNLIAKLSPEILELPASDHDDKPPAQMIVLEAVLPAPEVKLTPVQSRASGVQAPTLVSGRHESDKPPAPFVYTPYSLFTKSQIMLMRAKGFSEYSRSTTTELLRVYPLLPTDVADELAMQDHAEKGLIPAVDTPGFSDSANHQSRWAVRASKMGKNFGLDVAGHHGRRPSNANTLNSPSDMSDDAEKGFGTVSNLDSGAGALQTPHVLNIKKRPSTADTVPSRRAFGSSKDKKDEANEEVTVTAAHGPPVYNSIRSRTDG